MDALASQLAHELTAHGALRSFVGRNYNLIGAYAEASVRQFIKRVVAPLHISTGTILYESNCGQCPPQLDVIVWSPIVAPAIFESGEFAIVPRGNAHAFLEIKSSNYDCALGGEIERVLSYQSELIVPSLGAAFDMALGVVCVRSTSVKDPTLDTLVAAKRAVVLMDDDGGRFTPRPRDVWQLIAFLLNVRKRAKVFDGEVKPVYPSVE